MYGVELHFHPLRDCYISFQGCASAQASDKQCLGVPLYSSEAKQAEAKKQSIDRSAKHPSFTSENFARLQTEDFSFEIRKDIEVLDFAKEQFLAWVEYLKNKLAEK